MICNKKVIICDINVKMSGHNIGFDTYIISNLDRILETHNNEFDYAYIYNSEALECLPSLENREYYLIDFPSSWQDSIAGRFRIWKKVKKLAENVGCEHLIFMQLDTYQVPIALSFFKFKFSSIYIRPIYRVPIFKTTLMVFIKSYINKYKKLLFDKIIVCKNQVTKIFILNDDLGCSFLNNYYNTNKFTYLPDPIFDYMPFFEIKKKTSENISFLIFGAISERKNITNILSAYNKANFNKPTILKIIGDCSEEYYSYLIRIINNKYSSLGPNKEIFVKNMFVSNLEMEEIYDESDISLLLYKNFYFSSGLLGICAKHKKYVITSSVGLMNDLVRSYNLGITADPSNIDSISKALEKSVCEYKSIDTQGFDSYYNEHKPDEFLKSLFL